MSYPSICIAGIDIELIQNLKKGICISNSQQTIEVRPLLKENHKWNIDEHGTINLYSVYEFEGEYLSKDFSKEDFYINSFKISNEIYELKNLSEDYYQIANNHLECCDGFLLINELIITDLPKKFSPFSKPHATLGIYEGIVGNIYLKGNQWRGDVNPHAFLDENSFCGDIPITDIRFYDVKNKFKAKSLEEIKTQFTFDEHEQINGLISLGLTREFNSERWLQINTIHPEELFLNNKYVCPLCSAQVNDYTNSKPSYNFPNFRCSNENCDQGNGFPWSSWDPNEFN